VRNSYKIEIYLHELLPILPHGFVLLNREINVLWEDVFITFNHPSHSQITLPFLLLFLQQLAFHVHEMNLLQEVLDILVLEVHVGIHS
jgi:hypothetical protein